MVDARSDASPQMLTISELSAKSRMSVATGRRMVTTTLLGSHSHETADGKMVHVWARNGRFLARGRYLGKAFGQALGPDPREAAAALRRLLVPLEDGTFLPPRESRKRQVKARQAPRNTIRHPARLDSACSTPARASESLRIGVTVCTTL
jgi:hypothetical protein